MMISQLAAVDLKQTYLNTSTHPGAATLGNSLGSLISGLLPNIIMMAGLISFGLIVYGGFQLIRYSGKDRGPAQLEKARNYFTFGVVGFLIVVSAYFILQIVSQAIFGNDTLINSPI